MTLSSIGALRRASAAFLGVLPIATLLTLVGCGGSEPDTESGAAESFDKGSAEAPLPSGVTVFREHQIVDPGLNNMVASTILVPENWTVEGGMTRPDPQYYSMPVLLDVKFTAPDGRQVHIYPSLSFNFNYNKPGQAFTPTLDGNIYLDLPSSPGEWLMDMARRNPDSTISNLRLISEEMDEPMTQQLRENNAMTYQTVQQTQQMGMSVGVSAEFDTQVTVLVLQYEQNGQNIEETVQISWQYYVNILHGQVTSGSWAITSMASARGPVGTDYLNDPEIMAIVQSGRPNPAWVNEMNKYWTELARIRAKGAADRRNQAWAAHQKRMQTLNETSDIIASGWKSRSTITDASHEAYIDSIHEVTPYQTPSGETVKLPSFYDHVYTDSNGRYILHNDSFYDPNTDPAVNNQNWQRIEQRP